MHTLNRNGDGTYCVGRVEVEMGRPGEVRSVFVPMFDLLKLYQALDLVSALNGGSGDLGDHVNRIATGKEVI